MRIQWLGHSAFRVEIGTSTVLIDPFLTGNPTFGGTGLAVADVQEGVTHVALTHGHDDHIGDAAAILKATGAMLVANWEICSWLGAKGAAKTSPGNHGGEIAFDDFTIAFVPAVHSSSVSAAGGNNVYLGNPAGIVLIPQAKGGKTLYHMGDTCMFGDMALVQELYAPHVGIVPIGDRFTMGARQAALACRRYFTFEAVLPCHYGTFGLLDADAGKFVAEMRGHKVLVPKPGETVEL